MFDILRKQFLSCPSSCSRRFAFLVVILIQPFWRFTEKGSSNVSGQKDNNWW